MEKHIEQIECPECGKRQMANVLHTLPWWSYVHDCVSCKYTIMESEWVLINTEDELKKIELANDVDGNIQTMSGYVDCEMIGGSVSTMSGDVNHRRS